jgi:hypothetical protein
MFPAGRNQSEDRHVDAGADGLIIDPTDIERMLARQRQISAAEQSLLRAIKEAYDEVAAEPTIHRRRGNH